MNLNKKIKFIFLLFFLFGFNGKVFGKENSFVTIVNPVRGEEFFDPKPQDFLEGFRAQKQLIDKSKLSATWLLRFDILNSPSVLNFKNFSDNQELGIFLEITPSLAKMAGISYPEKGIFWHDANKIFLSGFRPEDRIKLMDTVFNKFKENFGYYPKSVGAWHIDSYSANYMKSKYGISGVLICADQFGTDNYQIWGGWWGVPYYPSRYNILMPAQTLKNKLDLVVFWWAARDPDLGYGGSVQESIYSVQVNDYIAHGLGIDYFKKLLNIYLTNNPDNKFGQLTIGLENDSDWRRIGNGFEQQIEEVSRRDKSGEIKVLTMSGFSDWYKNRYQKVSPSHTIGNWVMTVDFRIGFFDKNEKKFIKDLRIYNENWPEANLLTANPWPSFSLNNPYKIDTVRFGDEFKTLPKSINAKSLFKIFGMQTIPFETNNFVLAFYYLIISVVVCYLLRKNISRLLVTIVGSFSLSLVMIKSGLVYKYGMGFWGPNGHDGVWHLALIEQLSKFSLNNPIFSQTKLTNYHLGFDLLAAALHHITQIPAVNLYFQVIPPIMAILIGFLTYNLVEKWTGTKKAAWWATFFVYFGGSWGWLISLVKTGRLGGESMFWANQSISTLINPPFALSIIFLLFGLIKFLDYLKKPSLKNLICCSLLFGALIQIKVYAGIIVLFSLFFFALFKSIYKREDENLFYYWKLPLLTLTVGLIIFLPLNFKAGSLLIFAPFWFPHTMLSYADRLGWFQLENARLAYFQSGRWIKWVLTEAAALLIFIFGNLGIRAVGFLLLTKKRVLEIEIVFLGILFASLMIPLFMIQKGNSWNTIQFFYYFQFFMAIFAGIVIGNLFNKLTKKKPLTYFVLFVLLVLTVLTTFTTLKNDYFSNRPPARISIEELEALSFLKNQPEGVVLSFPFEDDWRFKFSEPKPLYAYETTAYLSAFTSKQSFLADEMNLEITGYDWQQRKSDSNIFFRTADIFWGNNFIKNNKIKYIYLVKGQKMNLGLGDIEAEKIFENGEVGIFKIN